MKRILVLGLCVLLLSLGCARTAAPEPQTAETEPTAVPEAPTETEAPVETETPTETEAPQAEPDLAFDTVTLFGDPINTENLHEYDLIVVNCWAEWCPPCVGEMPELERIHQEFPNVLLLGVLSFSYDMDGAKETVSDTGVTYPVLEPAGTLVKLVNRFDAIPATMFFDSTGNEIANPIVGAMNYQQWKSVIEGLLP